MGVQYDLRISANRHKIVGWMRAGLVRAGHLGTPCNTFSRARDRPPGTPPLRSNDHVMGLPHLAPHDLVKVQDGNLFMRFSVSIMLLAGSLNLAFTMENPATSRIWLCPPVSSTCYADNIFPWSRWNFACLAHHGVNLLRLLRCMSVWNACRSFAV